MAGPSLSYRAGADPGGFIDITSNVAGAGTCPSSDPAYFCNAEVGYDSPTGNGSPWGKQISEWANPNGPFSSVTPPGGGGGGLPAGGGGGKKPVCGSSGVCRIQ